MNYSTKNGKFNFKIELSVLFQYYFVFFYGFTISGSSFSG